MRIGAGQSGIQIGRIQIGREAHLRPADRTERLGHQPRPQVRSADADANDRVERQSDRTGNCGCAQLLGEIEEPFPFGRKSYRPGGVDPAVGRSRSQRSVPGGPRFGRVDHGPGKQIVALPLHASSSCQRHQRAQRAAVEAVARQIHREGSGFERKALSPLRIVLEQVRDADRLQRPAPLRERLPLGQVGRSHGHLPGASDGLADA